MSYVAAVCGKGAEVNQVKEQLLQSNPVLEGRIGVYIGSVWLEQSIQFSGHFRHLEVA